MSTVGAPGWAPDGPASLRREPVAAVRGALEALARATRAARPRPGAIAPLRLPPAAREAWLDGLAEALAQLPVLALVVTPGAVLLGDTPVLDGADRALAEGLHRAGARAVTLFAGAPERELLALASLVATDWGARGDAAGDLLDAVWRADLPHAFFDLAEVAPGQARTAPLGALARLAEPPEEPSRLGALSPDASAALRELRATMAPDPTALLGGAPSPAVIPPDLSAEVGLLAAGADLDPAVLGAALLAAVEAAADPDGVRRVAHALLTAAVDLFGEDVGPLLHAANESVDADLAPNVADRAAAIAAYGTLAVDPLRSTLLARLPAAEAPELRGPLFSLFSLVRDEMAVTALAETLPRWAAAVLADTVLLREDAATRVEAVRARLASPSPAVAILGLAMAARLDEPRLVDPVLALADHAHPDVREGVLVALRQQTLPRVRDLVIRRLDDPAAAVRVEALRHGVAHRWPEILPRVEARLHDPGGLEDIEIRALCIAYGRLAREAAETPLLDLALGRRKLGPAFARYALHGLRAAGTPGARAALEHVASEVPRLRDEAVALLGEAR